MDPSIHIKLYMDTTIQLPSYPEEPKTSFVVTGLIIGLFTILLIILGLIVAKAVLVSDEIV